MRGGMAAWITSFYFCLYSLCSALTVNSGVFVRVWDTAFCVSVCIGCLFFFSVNFCYRPMFHYYNNDIDINKILLLYHNP